MEIRAEFIKSAMLEDRNEIRLIKNRVYQLASLITISSFAITAFLARGESIFPNKGPFLVVVDIGLLALLWVSFFRLKIDLYNARLCLEVREQMIRELGTEAEKTPFDPFPPCDWGVGPKIKDHDLIWIAGSRRPPWLAS